MERVAIFVDAGYLFAQGSILISGGQKLPRGQTRLDEPAALALFESIAHAETGLPILRTYWYDGTNAGPSQVHTSLAYRPNVKVRLGIVNAFGEQKGVDSLIITDLINLSRNRAMAAAVLLTGDEDIRVGVQQAQELGVRVHLVGLANAQHNQSNLLRQEADTLREVSKAEVDTFLTQVAPVPPPVLAATASVTGQPSTGQATLAGTANTFAASLTKVDSDRVANSPSGVPNDIDRQLLRVGAASRSNASLTDQEKRELRKVFIAACKART